MQGDVTYISPDDVAEMILAEPKRDDFLVIGAHLLLLLHDLSLVLVAESR